MDRRQRLVLIGGLAFAMHLHAAPVEKAVLMEAIDDAGVSGNVEIVIDEAGVARLTGLVSEQRDGQRAVDAVEAVPGVTRVIDHMRTDD